MTTITMHIHSKGDSDGKVAIKQIRTYGKKHKGDTVMYFIKRKSVTLKRMLVGRLCGSVG